jgi:hypothetical protein
MSIIRSRPIIASAGAVLLHGSDANVTSFDKIDAIRCGNAAGLHSLYMPTTGGAIVGQLCGSCVAIGRYNTSGYGSHISVYTEGCLEDVVMAAPFSGSSYHILFNEYALSLSRCYVEAIPRRNDNTLVETSMGWRNGRFSLGGASHKFEKSPYGGSSGANPATIVLDRPTSPATSGRMRLPSNSSWTRICTAMPATVDSHQRPRRRHQPERRTDQRPGRCAHQAGRLHPQRRRRLRHLHRLSRPDADPRASSFSGRTARPT